MRARKILRYVELKSGYSDNGPAWIGYVQMSRTAETVYFNGRALRRIERGRYEDIETAGILGVRSEEERSRQTLGGLRQGAD